MRAQNANPSLKLQKAKQSKRGMKWKHPKHNLLKENFENGQTLCSTQAVSASALNSIARTRYVTMDSKHLHNNPHNGCISVAIIPVKGCVYLKHKVNRFPIYRWLAIHTHGSLPYTHTEPWNRLSWLWENKARNAQKRTKTGGQTWQPLATWLPVAWQSQKRSQSSANSKQCQPH